MSILEKMDDKGRKLSLGLVSQVAQYQGDGNDKE
jgi:hypothetical protein